MSPADKIVLLRTALERARETLRLVSLDGRVISPIATRTLSEFHAVNEALAATAEQPEGKRPVDGRDISVETVLGMRVAAWSWEEPINQAYLASEKPSHITMTRFATHWSTGPAHAERLFRERDIRVLLSQPEEDAHAKLIEPPWRPIEELRESENLMLAWIDAFDAPEVWSVMTYFKAMWASRSPNPAPHMMCLADTAETIKKWMPAPSRPHPRPVYSEPKPYRPVKESGDGR